MYRVMFLNPDRHEIYCSFRGCERGIVYYAPERRTVNWYCAFHEEEEVAVRSGPFLDMPRVLTTCVQCASIVGMSVGPVTAVEVYHFIAFDEVHEANVIAPSWPEARTKAIALFGHADLLYHGPFMPDGLTCDVLLPRVKAVV